MMNYWVQRRMMKDLIDEMIDAIKICEANGIPPDRIDFSGIFAKYPRIRVGARRLLAHIKKEYGVG